MQGNLQDLASLLCFPSQAHSPHPACREKGIQRSSHLSTSAASLGACLAESFAALIVRKAEGRWQFQDEMIPQKLKDDVKQP